MSKERRENSFMKNAATFLDRRQLLGLLAASGSSLFLPSLWGDRKARAAGGPPARLFVYYTPHGPVQQNTTMRPTGPGGWNGSSKTDRDQSYAFALPDDKAAWSQVLSPLYDVRKKLLVLEGLAMTSALADVSTNAHNSGTSHALTGAKMNYPGGFKREGGGGDTSVDQRVADKIADPNRIKSLYFTTGGWSPLFRGTTELVAQQSVPRAYDKLFPIAATGDATTDYVRSHRAQALEPLSKYYDRLLPRLSGEDKLKLASHRDLVADLSRQVAFKAAAGAQCTQRPPLPANANPDDLAHPEKVALWGQMIGAALACDMSRVAVLTNTSIAQTDAATLLDVHTDLHLDIAHNATPANPDAFAKMTAYYKLLASEFAGIVAGFDKIVVDGSQTLLDQTMCVWLCELANGPHDLHDILAVVAGGGGFSGFSLGRYVKYPEVEPNPRGSDKVGPAHNKLLVSVMQSFGLTDNTIGMTKAATGGKYDLDGPLPMLEA